MELAALVVTGIVGIGGLALAALTQWLSYRERGSALRQEVYKRQMESIDAILCAVYLATRGSANKVSEKTVGMSDEDRAQMMVSLFQTIDHAHDVYIANSHFLPSELIESLNHAFAIGLDAISSGAYTAAINRELNDAFVIAINQARQTLGINALSQDILAVIQGR